MENIDIIVFVSYCIVILSIGLYVSRDKKGSEKVQKIIFSWKIITMVGNWSFLIAANISAEQL